MIATAPKISVDRIFRAFADRTRLRILHLLHPGELCVCNLVEVLDVPQPKVSRHLAYLREARLVISRKEGSWSYYRIAPATSDFHQKLLECLKCCFSDVPELTKDAARLSKRRAAGERGGPCC